MGNLEPVFGLSPLYDSQNNATPNANEYSGYMTQAVYQDDMWDEDQLADFAGRTIFMVGMQNAAMHHLTSGENKTYVTGTDTHFEKYAIGALNNSIILRGGSPKDCFIGVGAANLASVGFANNGMTRDKDDNSTEITALNLQCHVTKLVGMESHAMIGRKIVDEYYDEQAQMYRLAGPVDGRNQTWKEDDIRNPVPACIGTMVGAANAIWLDSKRTQFDDKRFTNPSAAGTIGTGYATQSIIMVGSKTSWVNMGEAIGNLILLGFANLPIAPGCNSGNTKGERPGSTIRQYIGAQIREIGDTMSVNVRNSVGAFIADQIPGSGGGAPILSVVDENTTGSFNPEQRASLITRGDTVFGDGWVGTTPTDSSTPCTTGYNTDVVHIRDLLHLEPRTSPPMLSSNVPPSDRVGLVYFDLTRNCLRVSLACEGETPSSWTETGIVWADLVTNIDAMNMRTDLAGVSLTPEQKAALNTEDVRRGIEKAKEKARDGTTMYLRPRVEIIPQKNLSKTRGQEAVVSFLTSGFRGGAPRIYWRRLGMGKDNRGATHWSEITSENIGADRDEKGMETVLTAAEKLTSAGPDGYEAVPGQVIQFILVDRETAQTTGGSFVMD